MTTAVANSRAYYQDKIASHGPCPAGVDWGHEQAQVKRFEQLLQLIPAHAWRHRPSLNDLGCGYGALLGYLKTQDLQADYLGIDLVPDMIDAGRQRWGAQGDFTVGAVCPREADYSVASGLFNVRNKTPEDDWQDFIVHTLDDLNFHSRLGFAFNCLTRYSDPEHMRPHLHYGDPLWFFDWCKRKYSRNVALLHDYDLYDFTIIVRKDAAFAAWTR